MAEIVALFDRLYYGAQDLLRFGGPPIWMMIGVALALAWLLARRR